MNEEERQATIDEISAPQTIGDLWAEMEKDLNIEKKLLTFRDGLSYRFRLIGPFIKIERLYLDKSFNLSKIMSCNDFKEIVGGNKSTLKEIEQKVLEILPVKLKEDILKSKTDFKVLKALKNKKEYKTYMGIVSAIENLGSPHNELTTNQWQSCIMSNAYMQVVVGEDGPISIDRLMVIPLICSTCKKLVFSGVGTCLSNDLTKKINGIYAHDITLSRSRDGNNKTKYDISLYPNPYYLSPIAISHIAEEGLIDIIKLLKKINRNVASRQEGYFYRFADYKMPETLNAFLDQEIGQYEEDMHFEEVEENIQNLPTIAMEDSYNSIGSLEVS